MSKTANSIHFILTILVRLTQAALLFISLNHLQAAQQENKTWLGLFSKKTLQEHPSISFWQEIQWRYDLEQGGMQQLLTRVGVLHKLSPTQEVGLLPAYIQNGQNTNKEYRFTFQHQYTYQAPPETPHRFSLRSRLEWRDLENNDHESWRYRLQAQYRYQISPLLSGMIWSEPFVNITRETWTGDRFLERHRLFIGTRWDLPDYRWEIGYLNQYVPRHNLNTSEHSLVVYLFF